MALFARKFFLLLTTLVACVIVYLLVMFKCITKGDSLKRSERTAVDEGRQAHLFENSCRFAWTQPNEPSLYVGFPHPSHFEYHEFDNSILKLQRHVKRRKDNATCERFTRNVLIRDSATGQFIFGNESCDSCVVEQIDGALRPLATTFRIVSKENIVPSNTTFWVNADNFVITCFDDGDIVFRRQYTGIKDDRTALLVAPGKAPRAAGDNAWLHDALSISILVLDSTSRSQFARHMPSTSRVMDQLGFVTMQAYNKVGDNSAVNILPILARPLDEAVDEPLFDATGDVNLARILPHNVPIDADSVNWIWKELAPGCRTMFNDDIMHLARGLFHYPHSAFQPGFQTKPTRHYYRPYYTHLYTDLESKWKLCWDGRLLGIDFLDTWFRVTHDNPTNLEHLDEYLEGRLRALKDNGALERTVLVIMGDHGQRVHPISRYSFAGKIEERAPLLSIYMPSTFRNRFPQKFDNLQQNSQRFVSNFDLHETLLSIVKAKIINFRSAPNSRGRSLFETHDADKDCLRNNVASHFCLCMVDAEDDIKAAISSDKSTNKLMNYIASDKQLSCLYAETLLCQLSRTAWMPNNQVQVSARNKVEPDKIAASKKKKSEVFALDVNPFNISVQFVYVFSNCSVRTSSGEDVGIEAQFRVNQDLGDPVIVYPPRLVAHKMCSHFSFPQDYCSCIRLLHQSVL